MTLDLKTNFNPLVSIVIPVFNGSIYMREAIDSALAQTYKNIEIIVVNDGSTDNTEEIALSYGNKIRYFAKENGGVATALNFAIENMRGEYFSWLSHDDIYLPNKIERQIEELAKLNDKNTIIYSNFFLCDSKMRQITSTNYEYREAFNYLSDPIFPILCGCISGCTLLVPKEYIIEFCGFNPKLIYTQDYDLWNKIFPRCRILFLYDNLVKERFHRNNILGT